ncbi:hypothetical protein [Prosthecobacter sp.]|uniref:hypothetical protein n=1 Tax=Prosthecobacter sp. TaxID=1965333 RepID=UPI001DE5791E|nr:hypothetical protein [Prosthecobacter sp.]MCB1276987.1 hypothetical protein [Prosthecobacter sp.]
MKLLVGRFISYALESRRHSRLPGARQDFGEMMRLFPRWLGSLKSSPMADRQPWMTYSAIEFLRRNTGPEMSVFEWGAGGSTLFFSTRVKHLFTVEHERLWAEKVEEAMAGESHASWKMQVVEPEPRVGESAADPSDPRSCTSAVEPWQGMSFVQYAGAIDIHADGAFDWVIVDGRSRPSCAMHGIPKVRPGGFLVLDDAERERYGWVHHEMRRLGWECHSFAGPVPYAGTFGSTTAWRRPADS